MFKNLLKKSRNLQPKLGRWGVTYDLATLDKRINWANHDHCGSEVCEKHFTNNKEVENWDEYLKKKKKNTEASSTKKDDDDDDDDDNYYYVPYCL